MILHKDIIILLIIGYGRDRPRNDIQDLIY